MDKIKECLERVRVIRGVNHGLISDEQLQSVFSFCQLDEKEKNLVYGLLEKEGVTLIPIDEHPHFPTFEETILKITPTDELRLKYLTKCVRQCLTELYGDSSLALQYLSEFRFLVREISRYGKRLGTVGAYRCITNAVMRVSRERAINKLRNGSIYSSAMVTVAKEFENWLTWVFPEALLDELVYICKRRGQLQFGHQMILIMLLHNTPTAVIRPADFSKYNGDGQ